MIFRKKAGLILNILIVLLVIVGTVVMISRKPSSAGLTSSGFENLKFFTVLSNEFCGIVALLWLICFAKGKSFPVLLKLIAATAVGLTFLIVAAFLAPMYPTLNLYQGGNLYFHLIVPLVALVEFILMETEERLAFRYTFLAALPTVIYGLGYYLNVVINGKGVWPDTNDWYGFLNWGYPVGFAIFGVIILMNWGIACLLRFVNNILSARLRTKS